MRIVSGIARGHKLKVPPGRSVRPTTDRVREAIFSSLGDRLLGARILDLFAGSGALGLEAASRGAKEVVFVEQAAKSRAALASNIQATRLEKKCRTIPSDALRALAKLASQGEHFDVIFLDPPYESDLLSRALQRLAESDLLAEGGLIVAEHRKGRRPALSDELRFGRTKSYGDIEVSFVERTVFAQTPFETRKEGMGRVAIYPGSFDPFTNGHLGIAQRALAVFDKLIIAIAINSRKQPFFSVEERVGMIGELLAREPRVEVQAFEGLTVGYAAQVGASVIIRGLRAVADFEYELQMANMNRKLQPNVETLFMMTSEPYFFVSSQNVKEVASFDGDITDLVPPLIADRVIAKVDELRRASSKAGAAQP